MRFYFTTVAPAYFRAERGGPWDETIWNDILATGAEKDLGSPAASSFSREAH